MAFLVAGLIISALVLMIGVLMNINDHMSPGHQSFLGVIFLTLGFLLTVGFAIDIVVEVF